METGTARGFSNLYAKALMIPKYSAKFLLLMFFLMRLKPIGMVSQINQRLTRQELLSSWKPLVDSYITFVEGDTLRMLRRISLSRVNIAFLDACHTYNAVINECKIIASRQVESDLIVFDDVNQNLFPGVVKAIQVISSTLNYGLTIYDISHDRKIVVAEKLSHCNKMSVCSKSFIQFLLLASKYFKTPPEIAACLSL